MNLYLIFATIIFSISLINSNCIRNSSKVIDQDKINEFEKKLIICETKLEVYEKLCEDYKNENAKLNQKLGGRDYKFNNTQKSIKKGFATLLSRRSIETFEDTIYFNESAFIKEFPAFKSESRHVQKCLWVFKHATNNIAVMKAKKSMQSEGMNEVNFCKTLGWIYKGLSEKIHAAVGSIIQPLDDMTVNEIADTLIEVKAIDKNQYKAMVLFLEAQQGPLEEEEKKLLSTTEKNLLDMKIEIEQGAIDEETKFPNTTENFSVIKNQTLSNYTKSVNEEKNLTAITNIFFVTKNQTSNNDTKSVW